ncbi:hypothetical protein N7540_010736 [Penicillium herquei]|nr:hypothetical protein N7540_010736 [Penicillium herquei]
MQSLKHLAACCDGEKIDYPIHRFANHNSKKLTQTLQKAEKALDNFWNELSSGQFKADIDLITGGDNHPIPGFWPEQDEDQFRTPDWVEPQDRPSSEDSTQSKKRSRETMEDLKVGRTSPDERKPKKIKTKTRGVPTRPNEEDEESSSEEEEEPITFTLKRRDYELLDLLFFLPNRPVAVRELKFTAFVRFMTAIGFQLPATGMSSGSAVRFDPPEVLAQHGSIVFHAPHPESSYNFGLARIIGGRLFHHYGLKRESFQLEEKGR